MCVCVCLFYLSLFFPSTLTGFPPHSIEFPVTNNNNNNTTERTGQNNQSLHKQPSAGGIRKVTVLSSHCTYTLRGNCHVQWSISLKVNIPFRIKYLEKENVWGISIKQA